MLTQGATTIPMLGISIVYNLLFYRGLVRNVANMFTTDHPETLDMFTNKEVYEKARDSAAAAAKAGQRAKQKDSTADEVDDNDDAEMAGQEQIQKIQKHIHAVDKYFPNTDEVKKFNDYCSVHRTVDNPVPDMDYIFISANVMGGLQVFPHFFARYKSWMVRHADVEPVVPDEACKGDVISGGVDYSKVEADVIQGVTFKSMTVSPGIFWTLHVIAHTIGSELLRDYDQYNPFYAMLVCHGLVRAMKMHLICAGLKAVRYVQINHCKYDVDRAFKRQNTKLVSLKTKVDPSHNTYANLMSTQTELDPPRAPATKKNAKPQSDGAASGGKRSGKRKARSTADGSKRAIPAGMKVAHTMTFDVPVAVYHFIRENVTLVHDDAVDAPSNNVIKISKGESLTSMVKVSILSATKIGKVLSGLDKFANHGTSYYYAYVVLQLYEAMYKANKEAFNEKNRRKRIIRLSTAAKKDCAAGLVSLAKSGMQEKTQGMIKKKNTAIRKLQAEREEMVKNSPQYKESKKTELMLIIEHDVRVLALEHFGTLEDAFQNMCKGYEVLGLQNITSTKSPTKTSQTQGDGGAEVEAESQPMEGVSDGGADGEGGSDDESSEEDDARNDADVRKSERKDDDDDDGSDGDDEGEVQDKGAAEGEDRHEKRAVANDDSKGLPKIPKKTHMIEVEAASERQAKSAKLSSQQVHAAQTTSAPVRPEKAPKPAEPQSRAAQTPSAPVRPEKARASASDAGQVVRATKPLEPPQTAAGGADVTDEDETGGLAKKSSGEGKSPVSGLEVREGMCEYWIMHEGNPFFIHCSKTDIAKKAPLIAGALARKTVVPWVIAEPPSKARVGAIFMDGRVSFFDVSCDYAKEMLALFKKHTAGA
jgi:hypothetical protein